MTIDEAIKIAKAHTALCNHNLESCEDCCAIQTLITEVERIKNVKWPEYRVVWDDPYTTRLKKHNKKAEIHNALIDACRKAVEG